MHAQGALLTLREANSELREAQADLRAYPVPEYLSATLEQGSIMIGVTGYPGYKNILYYFISHTYIYIH